MGQELNTAGMQSDIALWASEMAQGDMNATRTLIASWSRFTGDKGKPLDIYLLYGPDPWPRVSPGWTGQIYRKAKAAYEAWQLSDKTIDLFADLESVAVQKRARRRKRYVPEPSYDGSVGKSMPDDGEYNHPADLNF